MMGAYLQGAFSNFDFLDRFSDPLSPLPQCGEALGNGTGPYQLQFANVGCETGWAHWERRKSADKVLTRPQPHNPLSFSYHFRCCSCRRAARRAISARATCIPSLPS